MEIKVAILVDGEFFLKRYRSLNKHKAGFDQYDPVQTAKYFQEMIRSHIKSRTDEKQYLYRALYYDCFPFRKKVHNPVTGKSMDFSKSKIAGFRMVFLEELKKQRKVALRLGEVKDHAGWVLRPQKTKELLNRKITVDDLKEDDVYYDLSQKGVDMRIGLDIAALSYKRLVDRIILVSGDSDFVPAAKVARREGIDFILDPMWNHIDNSLFEHIDGLRSMISKPQGKSKKEEVRT
jgi:uncharacterized LabA/DUF88 family protein